MSDIFTISENPYKFRNFQIPYSSNERTVKFGIETATYMGPQIWNLLPYCLETTLFEIFTREIKK